MSGGGVRDSIESGDITYKNVLKVQPFGNTLVHVDMKGSEVEQYLAVVANMKPDSGAYAQFANVSLVADGKGVSEVKINGQPLQADKTYRMATLNFNALGGDGYPKLDGLPSYVNTGFIDAEVLKQYIEKHSPLDAAAYRLEGRDRLSLIATAAACSLWVGRLFSRRNPPSNARKVAAAAFQC